MCTAYWARAQKKLIHQIGLRRILASIHCDCVPWRNKPLRWWTQGGWIIPLTYSSSLSPSSSPSSKSSTSSSSSSPSSLSWLLPPGGGRGGDRRGLENSSCTAHLGNNSDGQHYNQIWNGSRRLWIMEDHDEKLDQDHKQQHNQVGGCWHSAAQAPRHLLRGSLAGNSCHCHHQKNLIVSSWYLLSSLKRPQISSFHRVVITIILS